MLALYPEIAALIQKKPSSKEEEIKKVEAICSLTGYSVYHPYCVSAYENKHRKRTN